MRTFLLANNALLIGIGVLSVAVVYRYQSAPHSFLAAFIFVMILIAHVGYIPAFIYRSMSKEWRFTAPIWLHLPRPGYQLLSAKVISALIAMTISLLVTSFFLFLITLIDGTLQLTLSVLPFSTIRIYALSGVALIYFASIFLGIWILFYSVAVAACKYAIRPLRTIVGIAVFLIPTWLMPTLGRTFVYDKLVRWAPFQIHFPVSITLEPGSVAASGKTVPVTMYYGEILFEAFLLLGVFLLAGWLIDRKVEA